MNRRRHEEWVTPESALDACLFRLVTAFSLLVLLAGAVALVFKVLA